MSLLDDVSIVVTPNGYKAGTLYGVLPTNGDADMDFTRATAATRVDEDGLIKDVLDNVPRIDYTGGGCPHILAEPESTNNVTYSEDFTDTWVPLGSPTITSNYGTSPDGTQNSTRVQGSSSAVIFISNGAATTNFSRSIYIKATSGSGNIQALSHNTNTNNVFAIDGNWQRIDINSLTSTTGNNIVYGVDMRGASTDIFDVEIWGCQEERGIDYATSYIPTSGSTVTRNQDIFTRDGIGSLINSTEGVLFVEMAALSNDLTARRISINDGSFNNIVEIGYTSGTNEIKNRVKSDGGTEANMNYTATDILDNLKIALKWKVNDFAVWVNGVEVLTDTSGAAPIGLSAISFDRGDGTQNYFGKVKQLQVYTSALTDEQLKDLTT